MKIINICKLTSWTMQFIFPIYIYVCIINMTDKYENKNFEDPVTEKSFINANLKKSSSSQYYHLHCCQS